MKITFPLALFSFLLFIQFGMAQSDKYRVTPDERAACLQDAAALCSMSTDEDSLIVCMKQNKTQLSTGCARKFDAGLKKRHLS